LLFKVEAHCDGLRRLTCHIQCTKQLTHCNVHTCECYHYKRTDKSKMLLLMLRIPTANIEQIEQEPAKITPQVDSVENHGDVEMILLNEV